MEEHISKHHPELVAAAILFGAKRLVEKDTEAAVVRKVAIGRMSPEIGELNLDTIAVTTAIAWAIECPAQARELIGRIWTESERRAVGAVEWSKALATATAKVAEAAALADAKAEREKDAQQSVPLQLMCPNCGKQHIDRDEWATRPHRTHLCEYCGNKWRPYMGATVGVV